MVKIYFSLIEHSMCSPRCGYTAIATTFATTLCLIFKMTTIKDWFYHLLNSLPSTWDAIRQYKALVTIYLLDFLKVFEHRVGLFHRITKIIVMNYSGGGGSLPHFLIAVNSTCAEKPSNPISFSRCVARFKLRYSSMSLHLQFVI